MDTPRVRFAPSPTGSLHLGSARTALYNWLYARQNDGQYLLRIEDTDRERSTPEAEAQIHRTLDWMGLGSDDPTQTIRQSERSGRYSEAIEQLRAQGHLYVDPDAQPDDAGGRPLRFRMGSGPIEFDDRVHGPRRFDAGVIQDPILVRSNGTAMYNLACAIDDADMGITHVIRGDDHLSNTPLQVAVLKALQADIPTYAHLPMILGPDGKKLSKRHGAASVEDYYDYLPEALLNSLVLLGWSPAGEGDNIFSLEEMIEKFRLEDVGASPAQFDAEFLAHVQGQHFRALDKDEWIKRYPGSHDPHTAHLLMHDKAVTWADEETLMRPLNDTLVIDEGIAFSPQDQAILDSAHDALAGIEGEWTEENVGDALRQMCTQLGIKPRKAIPVVQWATMGQRRGTSLFRVLPLLGRERSFERIDSARRPSLEHMDDHAPDDLDGPDAGDIGDLRP